MSLLKEAKMPSLRDKIEAQARKSEKVESKPKKVVKKTLGAVKKKK